MDTLLLDVNTWDLTVDSHGNIALATGLYALAQDAASSCRLFLGELWYDTSQGIPYLQRILGQVPPPLNFIETVLQKACLSVPGIASATATVTLNPNRELTGTIDLVSTSGQSATIGGSLTGGLPWYVIAKSPPPE